MRLAKLLDKPEKKYARPARAENPELITEGLYDGVAGKTNGGIDAWCDQYMIRLYATTIKTRSSQLKSFSTRTASSDSAVLGALCSIMRSRECGCFEAPEVLVAKRANVSENTAAVALRRLEDAAYIIRHPPCSYGVATKYSLVIERLDPIPPDSARCSLEEITELMSLISGDLSNEAYHASGIGKSAVLVYLHMAACPDRTMAEISRGIGRPEPLVKRAVKTLRAVGMADEEDGRWRVYTRRIRRDPDLNHVIETVRDAKAKRRQARRQREEERLSEQQREDRTEAALYAYLMAVAAQKAVEASADGGNVRDAAEPPPLS